MRRITRQGIVLLLVLLAASATSSVSAASLDSINRCLHGTIIDYTHNHGADKRIWSAVLCEKRDLYVYLPPGYDPNMRYPVVIWLHGVFEDERTFIKEKSLQDWDAAMASGCLPPMIIAIPDGSLRGRPTLYRANPLWLNSDVGKFEDYVLEDIWPFMKEHYPIRPERQAHVLGGFSGGAGAAFRLGIKYHDEFGVAFGAHPPLNLRWLDCHGRYFSPFDPNCWDWRTDFSWGREPVGRFYGVIVIRMRHLVYPLFGKGPDTVAKVSKDNPIEMLDTYNLRAGDLAMYIAYGGRDQFNITAQVDSFLFHARAKGLTVTTGFDPQGRHDWATATKLRPELFRWLAPLVAPYSPPMVRCNPGIGRPAE